MKNPQHLFYSPEHLWVEKLEDGQCLAGITYYAQDLLGDIVYVEPPKAGTVLSAHKPCGLVESVKTGSDLHAPMDGTVTEINEALLGVPEQINDAPYKAWIFKFTPAQADMDGLMAASDYEAMLKAS